MPTTNSYYPPTNDERARWWQVVLENATPTLTSLGYSSAQIAPILADAAWGVFCYRTVRHCLDDTARALTAYANLVLDGTNGTPLPTLPVFPTAPAVPAGGACGIEARRILWVQAVKKDRRYTPAAGTLLGIETPVTAFHPGTYRCDLRGVHSAGAHTVSGKFRKAGGHVDGINLYGRPTGTTAVAFLGRFNATPFNANVPLSSGAPEEWEFYAVAVKRDVEFGLPSAIWPVIVRA